MVSRTLPSLRGARTWTGRLLILGLLAGPIGCDGRTTAGARTTADVADIAVDSVGLVADIAVPAGAEAEADEEPRRPDPPAEIYYDLTAFDWYRRAEPLNVAGRPYRPAGKPEAGLARRFERVGEYQGVSYYIEEGTDPPYGAVFVPVAPRYWLRFVPVEG
ncbi:MAG TPA: hypothetical protein VF188_12795 [Longimicrobiales bacterium]